MRIPAKDKWVNTGIDLVAGRTYTLSAHGTWTDRRMSCGPQGYHSLAYPNRLVAFLLLAASPTRRLPNTRWFALVGAIAKRHRFVIGAGRTFVPTHDGPLWCFANDTWTAYGNNIGFVELTVTDVGVTAEQPSTAPRTPDAFDR